MNYSLRPGDTISAPDTLVTDGAGNGPSHVRNQTITIVL